MGHPPHPLFSTQLHSPEAGSRVPASAVVKGRQRRSKQERSDEIFIINALPLTSQINPFAGVTLDTQESG